MAREDTIRMSQREVTRLHVIQEVINNWGRSTISSSVKPGARGFDCEIVL